MGCGVCRRRHFLGTVIGWAAAQTSRYITVSAPTAVHVTKSGSNTNSGCTWEDAKLTIQAGLNTANTEGISQVWVKAGTYEQRITLKPSVGLYGGFEGDESALNERPSFPRDTADSYASVIDGQSGGNVVTASSVNSNTSIDGFTIQNGSTQGIRCLGTHAPTIANNRIRYSLYGICLDLTSGADGWIHSNEIFENGTGIYCVRNGTIIIEDNHIHHNGNQTNRTGVGIALYEYSSPTVNRNWIEYNNVIRSGPGGGISCWDSSPLICDNVVLANQATSGGAISISGVCSPIIACNTISNNSKADNGYGGAVYVSLWSSPMIANNVIYQNNTGMYRPTGAGGTPVLHHNCSWNVTANYSNNISHGDDFEQNPYVAADNVHLTSNSTICINNAYASQVYGPYDIDGEPRTKNGYADIGADEY